MNLSNRSNKGFSLAEMIIAVVIVGFFAALVMGVLTNASAEALSKTKASNATSMNEALVTIYGGGGTVPSTDVNTLVTALKAGVTLPGTSITIALPSHVNPNPNAYRIVSVPGGTPNFIVDVNTSAPSEKP